MIYLEIGKTRLEVVFYWGVGDEGDGEGGKGFGWGADVGGDEAVVEEWVGFFELLHEGELLAFLVLEVWAV